MNLHSHALTQQTNASGITPRLALVSALMLALSASITQANSDDNWALSYQLEAKQKYAEAQKVMESVSDTGRDAELLALRNGWLLYLQDNYSDAIRAYNKALQINPRSLDARLGFTLPLMAQSRWQEAARQAQLALDQASGNYTAHLRLLACELALQQWDQLRTHAQQLNALFPAEHLPWLYLGYALQNKGKNNEARSAFQQVLIRSPENGDAKTAMQKL